MTTDRLSRPHLLDDLDVAPPSHGPGSTPRRPLRAATAAAGGVGLLVVALATALTVGGSQTQTVEQPPAAAAPGPAEPDAQPPAAGTDLVVDGADTATIAGFTDRDGQVVATTNRIRLLTGSEADTYAAARGWEVPVPNDQLLVDDDPRLRDYPVRPDAPVTLTIPLSEDPDGEPTATTLPALRELLAGPSGDVHPFELVVEDGVVVELRMLYQP